MGDVDSRKSTTAYIFTLESGAMSWVSRLQKVVALSMTESEYVATTEAYKELKWLHGFMKELARST